MLKAQKLLTRLRKLSHRLNSDRPQSLQSTNSTRRSHAVLSIEQLELRCLLSAAPPVVLDISGLTFDPDSYEESTLLVRFDESLLSRSNVPSIAEAIDLPPGLQVGQALDLVPGLHRVHLPQGLGVSEAIASLQNIPGVSYAEPDYHVRITATPNDPRFDELWGFENTEQTNGTLDADIDATGAWDIHTGSGNMIVAVLDTGVDFSHPDLATNMWINLDEANGEAGVDDDGNGYVDDVHGYDFFNDDGNPTDDNGHGTHVAGTIGAQGNDGIGITGVNWDVQIMALKFLGADGSGPGSGAIEALEYAVANGAKISNNSYGGDPFSQVFLDAIVAAEQQGHLFVAASGNGNLFGIGIDNDATAFYPSSYASENVLAVAAVNSDDQLASFSNYGQTSVDVAAPGVDILSTQPGGGYGLSSGTSMATPHVAGLAALVWDANPAWTYDQVIDQIVGTVDVLPSLSGLVASGGRINAASALGNPQPPPPPPPPPPPATLPHEDDFNDGLAQNFVVQSGNWDTASNRYNVAPGASNDNLPLLSVLPIEDTLPAELEISATLNADEGYVELLGIVISDFLTNAFVVFDYQSSDDFRFAGADMDNDQWVVGRYESGTWSTDATLNETLNSATNYHVRVLIENDTEFSLTVGGIEKLSHTFASSLTDGEIGLGSRNSSSHFDNLQVREFLPPPPVTLPYQEDFDDEVADLFTEQAGDWSADFGYYRAVPVGASDAVSTLVFSDPLPDDLEIHASMYSELVGIQQNGFIVYDYQGPTDFKFAGAFVGTNEWAIGHRDGNGWVKDKTAVQTINTAVTYDLQVTINNTNEVALLVDGQQVLTHTFADVLNEGAIGVASRQATTRFDDVLIQDFVPPPPPPPVPFPYSEDFNSGSSGLLSEQSGTWTPLDDRYRAEAVGLGDAISTLTFTDPLPTELEIHAMLHSELVGFQQNGFVVFDYHSPEDFKFAGAFVGTNEWAIGHRDSTGWVKDKSVSQSIDTATDYNLKVVIQNDSATLYVDGQETASHTFVDIVAEGAVGMATRQATTRFDDLLVQAYVAPPPPPAVVLPLSEDFSGASADGFAVQSGDWSLDSGQYLATPIGANDAISTVTFSDPLPDDLAIHATLESELVGIQQNGFVIFDYQDQQDFKFAGAFVGTNEWAIGHRTAGGWVKDATVSQTISTDVPYDLQVLITNGQEVALIVDGQQQLTHSFTDIVSEGAIGLGSRQATSHFDDVLIQQSSPGGSQPSADFDGDNQVTGYDFLAWQRNAGKTSGASRVEGDADGDGDVDSNDLATWEATYGQVETTPLVAVANFSVLEPEAREPSAPGISSTSASGTHAELIDAAMAWDRLSGELPEDEPALVLAVASVEISRSVDGDKGQDSPSSSMSSEPSLPKSSSAKQEPETVWLSDELLESVFG